MQKYLLIDGFNLAFRSFYAVPELKRSDGFPTNAIHGWLRTLWNLQDREKPEHMPVFFDLGGAQERLKIHPEYKSNRGETPESLEMQIPYLKILTKLLGYAMIEQEGIEADDLIASVAEKLSQGDNFAIIVSSDKDLAQCLGDKVVQLLPPPTANPKLGWRVRRNEDVPKKFGVRAEQVVDYLALMGDSSDNIPGLAGVGPKTASKWIQEYGSINNIVAKANYLLPKRFQLIVPKFKDQLMTNVKLITLNKHIEVGDIENREVDPSALIAFFEKMEMKTAIRDVEKRYLGKLVS